MMPVKQKSSLFVVLVVLKMLVISIAEFKNDLLHMSSSQLQHASLHWKCRSDLEVQLHIFTVWHSDSFPVVFSDAKFAWPSLGSNPAFVRFGDGFAEFDPVFVVKSFDSASKTVLAETYINHTYAAVVSATQQPWIAEASLCCLWDATGPISSNGVVLRALVVAKASLAAPFLWLPPINFLRKSSNQQMGDFVKYYSRPSQSSVISISDPVGMVNAGFIESSFNKHPIPQGVSLSANRSSVVFQFDQELQKYTAFASFTCTSLVLSATSRVDFQALSISSQVVSTVCEGTNPIFADRTSRDILYESIAIPSVASLAFFTTSSSLTNLRLFVLSKPQSLLLLPESLHFGHACRSLLNDVNAAASIACMRIAVRWTPTVDDVGDSVLSILTYSADALTGSTVLGDVVSVLLYVAPPVAPSITFDESSTLSLPVRLNELVAVDLRSSSLEPITPTKPLPNNAALVSNKVSHSVFLFRPLPLQGSLVEMFCFQQSHSNLTVTSCLHVRASMAHESEISLTFC
jgi:hypothetical protein